MDLSTGGDRHAQNPYLAYSSRLSANVKKALYVLKITDQPNGERTAPEDFPSMQMRKSSRLKRWSWPGLVKQAASSILEIPRAISPAPGLQKQPVRKEILCWLACASMKR